MRNKCGEHCIQREKQLDRVNLNFQHACLWSGLLVPQHSRCGEQCAERQSVSAARVKEEWDGKAKSALHSCTELSQAPDRALAPCAEPRAMHLPDKDQDQTVTCLSSALQMFTSFLLNTSKRCLSQESVYTFSIF